MASPTSSTTNPQESSPLLKPKTTADNDNNQPHQHPPTKNLFHSSTPRHSELRTLIIASILCFIFFLIELIGGYLANSLAIMADASHLLSDLAGFVISILALIVSRLPANASLTYGFARAEVLGAFVSILLIWVLTFILVIFAVERLFNPVQVRGGLMLVLGIIGLGVNLGMGVVLGHSHREGSSHSHAHDLVHHVHLSGDYEPIPRDDKKEGEGDVERGDSRYTDITTNTSTTDGVSFVERVRVGIGKFMHSFVGHDIESINVRAAYLHVLGDALQNIGVIVAALIIMLFPSFSFVDPICTLLFAVIVISTTRQLAGETLRVLMEGTPEDCNIGKIYDALIKVPEVGNVGDLHVWSITAKRPSLSVHLWAKGKSVEHKALKNAQKILAEEFGVHHSTIQVNCEENACCDGEGVGCQNGEHCVSSSQLS